MQVSSNVPEKLFAFICLLSITSCSCPRDPTEAGLVCGIVNISTGAYEEDEASLDQELAASRDRLRKLRSQSNKIEAERHSLSEDRQRLALRLNTINNELSKSSQQLNELTQQVGVDRLRLEELRAQERELVEKQLSLGENVQSTSSDDVKNLEYENKLLREQIQVLLANTN